MKVLLLNYTDSGSGAAIAAERLLIALKQQHINAVLGVIEKKTNNPDIIVLRKKSIFNNINKIQTIKLILNKSKPYLKKLIPFQSKTTNHIYHSENKKTLTDINFINNSDYDLIHFHWINNDMISIEDIPKIKKPIIWTLHDFWAFCGAEHLPNIWENDTRFIEGYFKKNKPKTTTGIDICKKTWIRKKKSWKDCKFVFISTSNYNKQQFKKCALFLNSSSECNVIPNIIPKNIFKYNNKEFLKQIYQIPNNNKIIGFGAAYDITNKKSIKCGYLLLDALKKLDLNSNYYLVIYGTVSLEFTQEIKLPFFSAGFISNPYILASIYNLCDVFVCPSLLETLPTVCLEAMFCGVPVTAFETGGIPDIVEHKKTGYLAKCFDTDDLANGIRYCIENHDELSKNSLEKAHKDFDEETVVKKHIELYESVLK